MHPNLPNTLRRGADMLEEDFKRKHGEVARWTPWYIEAMREAADELEAAVADMSSMLGDVERIRQRCGVDNDDADDALSMLCGDYCAVNGKMCFEEDEFCRCKRFCWRGAKKDG